MPGDGEEFFITSSYSRIIARELRLQERDLPALLRGTGLPLHVLQPGDQTRLVVGLVSTKSGGNKVLPRMDGRLG